MCTIDSIRLQVMVFVWLKLIVFIYVFALGIYFAASTDLQQAFGLEFLSHGLSLIFLALLSMGIIFPQKYAVNKHNRFLLAMSFVFDTIVFAEMINYALVIDSYTPPEFAKELQEDCLRNTPEIYTNKDCQPFYEADRTAGLRLMWSTYFTDKKDKFSFQVLDTIQTSETCCGFFQPFRCIENKASFPPDRLQEGVSSDLLKQIVECGKYDNYYPEQDNCVDFFDFAADPPIIGGCEYDLGVGNCIDDDVQQSGIGCASALEDFVVGQISPHTAMLIMVSLVSLQFMTYACCMWWKRKESDVFPDFVTETKVTMRYRNVKDQFEVVPKRDLLIKEGFLPPPPTFDEEQGGVLRMDDFDNNGEERKHADKPGTAGGGGGGGGDNNNYNNDDIDEELDSDAPDATVKAKPEKKVAATATAKKAPAKGIGGKGDMKVSDQAGAVERNSEDGSDDEVDA